jgi:hypothetical protein
MWQDLVDGHEPLDEDIPGCHKAVRVQRWPDCHQNSNGEVRDGSKESLSKRCLPLLQRKSL